MEGKGSRRKRDSLTPHFCEIPFCEYTKVFQRHRIIPGREGGRYKLGNVIALCPNHHAEADRGWLLREELLAIVARRIKADEAANRPDQTMQELQDESPDWGFSLVGRWEDEEMGLQGVQEHEEPGVLPGEDS